MLAVFVMLLEHLVSASTLSIRGVPPSKLGKYTGTRFKCFSDHKDLPADRINDSACDCTDGSDEPGMPEQYTSEDVS
jgi:hypothetical protein